MTAKTYDAIVIGAGPGGSSCAALLAKKGMKVLLVEQNDRPGGKAMSVSNRGFVHELWPVTGGPRNNSRFESVLKALDLAPELADPEIYATLHYRNASGQYMPYVQPLPNSPRSQSLENLFRLLPWLELTPAEMEGFTQFAADNAALTPEDIDALDDISYHDYLTRYDIPQAVYSYMAAQCNVLFVVPFDQLAASEAVRTMQEMSTDGAGFYHMGGYGSLFQKYTDAFARLGGDVIMGSKVERILIEEGRVRGIETGEGSFHAPIVVSNAGIHPTVLKLAGETHFETDYIDYVKGLVPSLALMGIRYFLDEPVLEGAFHIAFSDNSYIDTKRAQRAAAGNVPEDLLIFVTIPSNYDPGLAPVGKQCLLVSTLCPPDPQMDNTQKWWDKIEEQVAQIWPEIPGHVESKERYGARHVSASTRDQVLPGIGGECIGLAQIVGQCGRHKPSPEAPIRGLFYVGCDAGGYGCGTHQAVTSGCNVADIVFGYHGESKG
ncbi:MAG: NAD(P)/FAD-dependent oxidoreductase [Desulfobacterales bacterium]